jgi:hypothetical protein
MKRQLQQAIALAIAATFGMMPVAMANPVQTPLQSPVVVTGNSNGSQANDSCRGFQFTGTPTQVVRVTQPNTALRFRVEGNGQLALLVTGANNPMCVPSAGSVIEVPGVWQPGTYSLYVGDRADSSTPFTLSVTQDN